MTGARFGILGPLTVDVDGRSVELAGPRPRALLALLLISANRRVSAERLADDLWEARPPPSAGATLQVYVSRLRKVLGSDARIVTWHGGYSIEVDPDAIDANRFERIVTRAASHESGGQIRMSTSQLAQVSRELAVALELWRGPALVDFDQSAWARVEADRLQDLQLRAVETRMDAELALGHHDALTSELAALVEAHPLRERLWGGLMLALYRSGRQSEALRAFQRLRHHLAEELGIEPGEQLGYLEECILLHKPELDWVQPAPGNPNDLAAKPPAEVPVGRRALCAAFVGRAGELAQAEAAMTRAGEGRGSVVVLSGEAGVGKTRLARQLAGVARTRGWEVLWGGCSEADLHLAFLPFLEAFGNYLGAVGAQTVAARLGPLVADLAQLLPQLGDRGEPPPSSDPAQTRPRLFEAIVTLVDRTGGDRGVLLVIEDIHWADASTRELLDYLARRLVHSRALLVVTVRREELSRGHPLAGLLSGWGRSGRSEEVALSALGLEGVVAMVEDILAARDPESDLGPLLYQRCDGNPFLLEELLKAALDGGQLFQIDDGWQRAPLTEWQLPATVADSVLARLDRLEPLQVEILRAAAVLGRRFPVAALATGSGCSDDRTAEALRRGMTLQLTEADPGGAVECCRFRHALTRDSVYADIVPPLRRRLHGRAADVLALDPATPPVDLAYHLVSAGRMAEAVGPCVAAAEDAMAGSGYLEAADLFQRAGGMTPDAHERGRLVGRAGEAWLAGGQLDRAEAQLQASISLLDEAGLVVDATRSRLALGRCHWQRSRPARARAEYERAGAALEPLGPSGELAQVYVRLASLHALAEEGDEALRLAERAIDVATEVGADEARLAGYNYLGCALVVLGRLDEGIAWMDRSYREALAAGLTATAAPALYNAAVDRFLTLRAREVPGLADIMAAMPATPQWSFLIAFLRGEAALFLGQVADSVGHYEDSIGLARRHAMTVYEVWASEALAQALAEVGDLGRAGALLTRGMEGIERQEVVGWATARLRVYQAGGDLAGAAAVATSALDAADWRRRAPVLIAPIVEALPAARQSDRAAGLVEGVTETSSPWLLYAGGLVAIDRDDLDTAVALLSPSASQFGVAGYALDEIRVLLALVQALTGIGRGAEARAAAERAGRLAQACGAQVLARQAAGAKTATQASGLRRPRR